VYARAAAKSGPVLESEAAELREHFGAVEGELREILASVKTEPDPPPPSYSARQLAEFTGRFEGADDATAVVELHDGHLVLEVGGIRTALSPAAERVFRNTENGVTVSYFGRAGTVEGISLERPDHLPLRLRGGQILHSDITGELPEVEAAPDVEPVVL